MKNYSEYGKKYEIKQENKTLDETNENGSAQIHKATKNKRKDESKNKNKNKMRVKENYNSQVPNEYS